ncbi:MAG: hypothetical protein JRF63_00640 [Deltaproteobacteria bacterium]|nr:hypothetical protein [Deltaproteobacteria bacterium]
MRARAALFVPSLVLVLVTPVLAQGPEDEAREHFDRGIELHEQGRFEQAAVAFERAYQLKPSFRILYNIGQVENELGHFAAALSAYRGYLEQGGDEVPRERGFKVKAEIERLMTLVGQITFEGAKNGAIVLIDREERGRIPLDGPIPVDLGKHEVALEVEGEKVHERVIKVAGGETVVVTVESSGVDIIERPWDDPDDPDDPADPATRGDEPQRVWTWIAFGVGGAAGVGAIITGSLALSKESDLRDRCTGGECPASLSGDFDSVERLALTTDILIGVAAAGVVAGTLLYFFEPDSGAGVEVGVAPAAGAGSAGLVLTGRF